jgi:phytoene dehydrogenase-like protein
VYRTTNYYDLIVLGSDLAGLVAATLVASRGRRVLLVPDQPIEGHYRIGSRYLPLETAPFVQARAPAPRRVFEELGLWSQIRRDHRFVPEWTNWIAPRHRLDVGPGHDGWDKEMTREWPNDDLEESWSSYRKSQTTNDAFLNELLSSETSLAADGFWTRRFMSKLPSNFPENIIRDFGGLDPDHPIYTLSRALDLWHLSLSTARLGAGPSMRLASLAMQGPYDLAGGIPTLRQALLSRFELRSGEVKPGIRLGEIIVRRGAAVGVTILGKNDSYGCDHLIIATDPRRLVEGLLPTEELPRSTLATLASIRAVASRATLHFEVETHALSPGLGQCAIVLPEMSAVLDEVVARTQCEGIGNIFIRRRDLPGEAGQIPTSIVSITKIVEGEDPITSEFRNDVLNELDRRAILPDIRPFIRWMHCVHDGLALSDGHGQAVTVEGQDREPPVLPMSPIYLPPGTPTRLGIGMVPHSSGIRNLHFASTMTYPGLGVEGSFITGLAAAGIVAHPQRPTFVQSLLSRKTSLN